MGTKFRRNTLLPSSGSLSTLTPQHEAHIYPKIDIHLQDYKMSNVKDNDVKKSFRFKFLSNHWSRCVCLNQSYETELV